MKKGDKLVCIETINNFMGNPLFIGGEVYEILYVDNEDIKVQVCLNHIVYANEYNTFDIDWVYKNFIHEG